MPTRKMVVEMVARKMVASVEPHRKEEQWWEKRRPRSTSRPERQVVS